jgi:hypothetical protein
MNVNYVQEKIFTYLILTLIIMKIYEKLIGFHEKVTIWFFKGYINKILVSFKSNESNFKNLLYHMLFYYIAFLLLMRSFFKKEHPIIIYFIAVLLLLNINFPIIDITVIIYIFFSQGFYFLSTDLWGEIFSEFLLLHPSSYFTLSFSTFLTRKSNSSNAIVRYMGLRAASSIFFGKSGLTPTGKASILIAASSSAALAYNSYQDRLQRFELQKNEHTFQAQESEKSRQESEKSRQHERERWTLEKERWAHEKERWTQEKERWAHEEQERTKKQGWWSKK